MKYIPGKIMYTVPYVPQTFYNIGKFVGQMHQAMKVRNQMPPYKYITVKVNRFRNFTNCSRMNQRCAIITHAKAISLRYKLFELSSSLI